ncbi:hypothetical protein MGSAQ_002315, partial [marine sediment metagenome]
GRHIEKTSHSAGFFVSTLKT